MRRFVRQEKCRSRPISRILLASRLAALRRDDHSSRPAIARRLQRPTRWLQTGRPIAPPYLALLHAGFCLPPTLPPARCALTAPFHPYLRHGACAASLRAVCFLCHCPSGCPARALPGALPFGVRTFLSPSPFAGFGGRSSGQLRRLYCHLPFTLPGSHCSVRVQIQVPRRLKPPLYTRRRAHASACASNIEHRTEREHEPSSENQEG